MLNQIVGEEEEKLCIKLNFMRRKKEIFQWKKL